MTSDTFSAITSGTFSGLTSDIFSGMFSDTSGGMTSDTSSGMTSDTSSGMTTDNYVLCDPNENSLLVSKPDSESSEAFSSVSRRLPVVFFFHKMMDSRL